jgi:hypothetical protein
MITHQANPATQGHDRISRHLAESLIDILAEAGTEIFNAAGSGNVVAGRLRAMRSRIEGAAIVEPELCDVCDGDKMLPCRACGSTGGIDFVCSTCRGSGVRPCESCDGEGVSR